MTENEILNLKKCVVKDTKMTQINISVFIVARACFNDERLVEDLKIKVESINGKELFWFDMFLGRKSDNKARLAVAYIEGNDVFLLKNDGEKSTVIKADYILASENYDESSLISTHIW